MFSNVFKVTAFFCPKGIPGKMGDGMLLVSNPTFYPAQNLCDTEEKHRPLKQCKYQPIPMFGRYIGASLIATHYLEIQIFQVIILRTFLILFQKVSLSFFPPLHWQKWASIYFIYLTTGISEAKFDLWRLYLITVLSLGFLVSVLPNG